MIATAIPPRTTVFVCTTCRRPEDEADAPRAGAALADAVRDAAAGSDVDVRPTRCLGNCKRGLSAAMQREGAWTYVFGHLGPDDAAALVAGGALLAGSTDGLMPWRGRPEPLKRGLIARIPPLAFLETAE